MAKESDIQNNNDQVLVDVMRYNILLVLGDLKDQLNLDRVDPEKRNLLVIIRYLILFFNIEN